MTYILDELHEQVRKIFQVDDITVGGSDQPFIVRYREN